MLFASLLSFTTFCANSENSLLSIAIEKKFWIYPTSLGSIWILKGIPGIVRMYEKNFLISSWSYSHTTKDVFLCLKDSRKDDNIIQKQFGFHKQSLQSPGIT